MDDPDTANDNGPSGDLLVFGAGSQDSKAEQKRKQMEEKMRKRQEELAKKNEERKKTKEQPGEDSASDAKAKKPAPKAKKPVKPFESDENNPEQANMPDDLKSTFEIQDPDQPAAPFDEMPLKSKPKTRMGDEQLDSAPTDPEPFDQPSEALDPRSRPDPDASEQAAAPYLDPTDRPIAPTKKPLSFDEDLPLNVGKKKQQPMTEYPEEDPSDAPPPKANAAFDADQPIRGLPLRKEEIELGPDGEPILSTPASPQRPAPTTSASSTTPTPSAKTSTRKKTSAKAPSSNAQKTRTRRNASSPSKSCSRSRGRLPSPSNDVSDPAITSEAVSKFHKYIDDSNPATLEKAVEFVSYFILNGGTGSYETAKMIRSLIEKSVTSAKDSTKETALGLLNHFFTNKEKDPIFEIINSVITKNLNVPKYVTAAYDTVYYLLKKHGPLKLDTLKPFVKATVQAAGSTKPQTKEAVVSPHPGHRLHQRSHPVDRTRLRLALRRQPQQTARRSHPRVRQNQPHPHQVAQQKSCRRTAGPRRSHGPSRR